MKWSKDYAPVPSDDDLHNSPNPPPQQRSLLLRTLKLIALLTFLLLALLTGILLGSHFPLSLTPLSSPPLLPTNCGHTSASALAAGCKMEPLTYAWMSPECYFPTFTAAQYQPFQALTWYRHENLTGDPLTEDQLMRGEVLSIWADDPQTLYHTSHCLFLVDKFYHAVSVGSEWIDSKSASVEHVRHCGGQLKDGWVHGRPNKTTNVVLGVYHCERAPWAKRG